MSAPDKTWRANTDVRVVDLPADFEELKRLAIDQGWVVKKGGNEHWKFIPPKGQVCHASATPSDPGWLWALRRRLKQNGLRPDSNAKPVNGAPKSDTIEYFKQSDYQPQEKPAPEEKRVMVKKVKYGALKDAILSSIERMASKEAYPEDILARVQALMPKMDLNKLKAAMNGYVGTGTLTKNEMGRYGLPITEIEAGDDVARVVTRPARPTATFEPPPPASEEDLKVLENLLNAMVAAEAVIRKHIDIQRQLGAVSALLGRGMITPKQAEQEQQT